MRSEIQRIYKDEVENKLFWKIWYSEPGTRVVVNDEEFVVTDHKVKQDQLQFVDVEKIN